MLGFIIAYLIGGLTFIPLVVAGLYFYAQASDPVVDSFAGSNGSQENKQSSSEPETPNTNSISAEGWIYLSQHYVNVSDSGAVETVAPSGGNETAKSSLKKIVKTKTKESQPEIANPVPKSLAKLPRYWAVVRGGTLTLYVDNKKEKAAHDLRLDQFVVTLWPPGAQDWELFYKKFAICIVSRTGTEGLVSLDMYPRDPPKRAYFLYLDNGFNKEDMYFALIKEGRTKKPDQSLGPRDPTSMAQPIISTEQEKRELLSRIYSVHESAQTQWFNALLGRLFLAVKDTKMVEDYYRAKIVYKLNRVKPSFIDDIEVKEIFCGTSIPYFVDLKLQDLESDGNLTLNAGISYRGGFFVKLATTAHITIPGFKPRIISLLLGVTCKSMEGRLVVKVKPPPSSRIWYSFESMPKLDLLIEPEVSQRQFNYSFITKGIANAIREALKESMVMPYMDDVSFFNTSDEFYRGGIWDTRNRPSNVPWHPYNPSDTVVHSDESGDEALTWSVPSSPARSVSERTISRSSTSPQLTADLPKPSNASISSVSSATATTTAAASATATAPAATGSKWKWSSVLRRKTSMQNVSDVASIKSEASGASQSSHDGSDTLPPPSPLLSPYFTTSARRPSVSANAVAGVTPTTVSSMKGGTPPKEFSARKPVPSVSPGLERVESEPILDDSEPILKQGDPIIGRNKSTTSIPSLPDIPDVPAIPASLALGPGRATASLAEASAVAVPVTHSREASVDREDANGDQVSVAESANGHTTAHDLLADTLSESGSIDRLSLDASSAVGHRVAPSIGSGDSKGKSPPQLPPKRRKMITLANVDPEPVRNNTSN